ncbi:MAG: hypothetical protein ABNH38_10070 [Tateyamaria sp.]|uniref:dCTP deaminase domain-containing protein n=1 Tax=Tateyamaria sp. TaxID=1929288 RepID=UPI0032DCA758
MAFWGRDRWLKEGLRGYKTCPVLPWDEKKVEAAGYRLAVGDEYFVNGDGTSKVNRLRKGDSFVIQPGQFAFILTYEKVYISNSSIGFISIRASLKFRGLVNVSGFQVNPGFSGNLVFAVFNAGPKHINIRKGDEIFSLWIADLDAPVGGNFKEKGNIPNNLDSIPSDVINGIAGEALTAYQLTERIAELREELRSLKTLAYSALYAIGIIVTLAGGYYANRLFEDGSAGAERRDDERIQSETSNEVVDR